MPSHLPTVCALCITYDALVQDGSGYIDKPEMVTVLTRLSEACGKGEGMTQEALDCVFAHADVDGDGKVSFGEFMQLFTRSDEIKALSLKALTGGEVRSEGRDMPGLQPI